MQRKVLKTTITKEGVWRISRRERSRAIEVFKVDEGHDQILTPEFLEWRQQQLAREVASMLG